MHPFRYMTEVASTNTFSPSMSKVLSIIPAAFSNCIEYEKPEHPPPTTPMRRPAGAGVCCPMMSLTLATALAVRLTGVAFLVTSGLVTSGTVVVAIRISLALKVLVLYQTLPAEPEPLIRTPLDFSYRLDDHGGCSVAFFRLS